MRNRLARILVVLAPLAAVGPNLGERGLRTEHLFAVAATGILWAAYGPPRRMPPTYLLVVLAWVTVSLVALVGGMLPVESLVASPERTVPEGVVRLCVPVAGMLIGAYAGFTAPAAARGVQRSPLELMMVALVVVACLNAAVTIGAMVFDLPWLALFHRGDRAIVPVSEAAADGGRYGGVINQPFEAGLLYSIALLTAIRLWHSRRMGMGRLIVVTALIGSGGALSGSKVFLLGGAVVALGYLVFGGRPQSPRRMVGVSLAVLGSAAAGWYVLAALNQLGLERIRKNYLPWNLQDVRWSMFGGRLEEYRTIDRMWVVIDEAGPLGLGGSGARWPYDIGVMEFAAVAGWVGIAAMVLISAILLAVSARHREHYWLALVVLVLAANLGGTSFTANRNALVIWILLGAMLYRHRAGFPIHLDPALPHRTG